MITSQVRLLYASGGIDARAIFSAKGRNAHAQLYHAFLRNHDIITSQVRLLYASGGIDARAKFSA